MFIYETMVALNPYFSLGGSGSGSGTPFTFLHLWEPPTRKLDWVGGRDYNPVNLALGVSETSLRLGLIVGSDHQHLCPRNCGAQGWQRPIFIGHGFIRGYRFRLSVIPLPVSRRLERQGRCLVETWKHNSVPLFSRICGRANPWVSRPDERTSSD
jgi:hypothetical protein